MGVRKGLGAAVGGVFGTAGKITGAAGKAFAILSLDEEYQRKRTQQQQKPPADLQVFIANFAAQSVLASTCICFGL